MCVRSWSVSGVCGRLSARNPSSANLGTLASRVRLFRSRALGMRKSDKNELIKHKGKLSDVGGGKLGKPCRRPWKFYERELRPDRCPGQSPPAFLRHPA